ncbi:hypothetical protein HPULCUR_002235 [Helicostylum pulchrum]|uniref:Uncharacterized protein n=1 Tax=Helicostylum pulchrum TaxID=562976 RepID=A0ABP9XPZ8_9FUNG
MTDSYYPSLHSRTLSDISVGEILLKYQDNSQLLNHILVAKAQEDKRRTAEELRQVEEARLQTKFIEYELTHRQENNSYAQNTNHSSNSIFGSSFMDHQDQFTHHVDTASSLQAGIDNSPVPLTSSEFHYGIQPECASIASSSPSVDFISPSNFELYGENLMLSSSPPAPDDLELFPPAIGAAVVAETKKANKGKKKSNASSSKNIHRTLSYESVMTLSDLNIRPKSASPPPPPPPQPPLDHDKVMEALRAKLRRSSSPYQNSRPKPSPEPTPPPPPNTYPTTGVLLLNLKNRRRKSSVTKRGNSSK